MQPLHGTLEGNAETVRRTMHSNGRYKWQHHKKCSCARKVSVNNQGFEAFKCSAHTACLIYCDERISDSLIRHCNGKVANKRNRLLWFEGVM